MQVDILTPQQWKNHSEQAHAAVFGEIKRADLDRIDYAMVSRDGDILTGYITCREWDAETIYWQFGGAFPGTKSTSLSFKSYTACVEYAKKRYKRVTTLIENTNPVMLKFAMKVGFKIVGIRNFRGQILLEHLLEFENVDNV